MEFIDALINVLNSTIRVSVPLLLACLAGLYSERAGIFDIGLEGKMLAGAFAAGAAAAGTAAAGAAASAGEDRPPAATYVSKARSVPDWDPSRPTPYDVDAT